MFVAHANACKRYAELGLGLCLRLQAEHDDLNV